MALTIGLTIYARWFLDYPLCGTDEQNYLKIFEWLDRGGSWPISGPGYAELIFALRQWVGLDTRTSVITVAVLNSALVLPLALWLLYRINLGKICSVWQCLPWLFISSYFLGPWLEGRPQQFGMVLVAMGAWLAHQDLRLYGKYKPGFFVIWILCFAYHALSFVILTTLAFGFWVRSFIQHHSGYRELAVLTTGLIGCLALGKLWYPLIWVDIYTNHIQGTGVGTFFGLLAVAATSGLLMSRWLRIRRIGLSVGRQIRDCLAVPLFPWLTAAIVGLALVWQYMWLGGFYRGLNPLHVLWYQGGNLLFGGLFLLGLWRLGQTSVLELAFFVESSAILMVLGAIFLILTPWLRDHNWTLRVITYWIWYAAPLAAWGWLHLAPRWRWGLLLICPTLLIGGLSHVLYAPTWTCQALG